MEEINKLLKLKKKSSVSEWVNSIISKTLGTNVPTVSGKNGYKIKNHKVFLVDGMVD